MQVVDVGAGVPVVVVPGVQGRWEWHAPAIDALSKRCRVLTFSYADEPSANAPFNGNCMDSYCDQILEALATASIERAALCGISYGGLVASVFAARHPEKVASLVLVSALPPTWTPNARVRIYLRAPRLLMPVFMLASLRLTKEILRARPTLRDAARVGLRHGWNVLSHMFSPARMARRAAQLATANLTPEVRRVSAPALVVVGEPDLDTVVPVPATLEYGQILPLVRVTTLSRTGHLGSITRPIAFAELVATFVEASGTTSIDSRRRLG